MKSIQKGNEIMNGTVIALIALTLMGVMVSLIIEHMILKKIEEQGSGNALLCNIGDTVYIVNFCPKERTDEIFDMPIRGEEWWIDRYTVRSEHSRYTMSGLILRGVAFLEEKDAMAYLQKARTEYENGQRDK